MMIIIILAVVIFLLVLYLYFRNRVKPTMLQPTEKIDELTRLKRLYINDELYFARIYVIENTKTVGELETYIRDKSRGMPDAESIDLARRDFEAVRPYINRGFRMDRAINYSNLRRLIEKLKKIDAVEFYSIIHGILTDDSGREYCDSTINSLIRWHLSVPDPVL